MLVSVRIGDSLKMKPTVCVTGGGGWPNEYSWQATSSLLVLKYMQKNAVSQSSIRNLGFLVK